jgi:hypothetical protein
METVSEIRFIPIKEKEGHVGFCDFLFENNILFKDIAVHKRRDGLGYRLVYPRHHVSERIFVRPQNKKTQEAIDGAITKFLNANFFKKLPDLHSGTKMLIPGIGEATFTGD